MIGSPKRSEQLKPKAFFTRTACAFLADDEFNERLARVRTRIAGHNLDAVIITNPENIYYLTGLNHHGCFAYTSLILPFDQEPVLIIRAMEKAFALDMVVTEACC